MKKLIFLFLLGFSSIYAIDERVIDFYYGNGIMNTEDEADDSKDILHSFISKNIHISTPYSVKLSYNYSYDLASDLAETYYQLKKEGQAPENFFTTLLSLLFRGQYSKVVSLMAEIIDIDAEIAEREDLTKMVNAYKGSISDGHKVILISHSQGNLFGVRSYDKLKSWQKRYFNQVSVASYDLPKLFS